MSRLAKLRASLYLVATSASKVAGVYGIVDEKEGYAWLLLASAVIDVAFFNVPGGISDKIKQRREARRGR